MKNIAVKTTFLFFFVLWFSSCGLFIDKDCFDNNEYKFYLPFTLTPAQDTFRINDTIRLHANFSHDLFDSVTLKYYEVENEPLKCYFFLDHIDTIGITTAFPDFQLFVDTGTVSTGGGPEGGLKWIKYVYDANYYKFYIRLIPLKEGTYWLSFGSEPQQHVNFQKKCPGELMDVYFTTNSGADNNFYFMALSLDSSINAVPLKNFNYTGSYCFRVVE